TKNASPYRATCPAMQPRPKGFAIANDLEQKKREAKVKERLEIRIESELKEKIRLEAERQNNEEGRTIDMSKLVIRYCKAGLSGEIQDFKPIDNLTNAMLENIKATNKIGTNLNQVLYLLHIHGVKPEDIPQLCEIFSKVNDLLLENVTTSREALNELRRI
ncbi:hypothetical protein EFU51_16835, partial [Vibrio cholerae]|nr:hypothetical protein [Vibrio cholerae]